MEILAGESGAEACRVLLPAAGQPNPISHSEHCGICHTGQVGKGGSVGLLQGNKLRFHLNVEQSRNSGRHTIRTVKRGRK